MEVAALDEIVADVIRGHGRAVLIAGDAGIGKTALLGRVVERARHAGAFVLTGECLEFESSRSLSPFIDVLRAAGTVYEPALVRRLLLERAPELARLVPELGATAASRPDAESGQRLGPAFAALFTALSRTAPFVVIIEDLHWADDATTKVVSSLARRSANTRLLLVATYRSDELHRRHPLRHTLVELARAHVETITIDPLSATDATELIRSTLQLNGPVPSRLRVALHERCEGNPFFIEEVLKALVERGDLRWEGDHWVLPDEVRALATPASLRDAVAERLVLLSPDARHAAQCAAVIGLRLEFELLREVTDLDEPVVLSALKESIEAQLIEETDDGTYRWRHALTRESVVAELLQRERRAMHLRVAEAIERRAGTDPLRSAELAYHFDEARDEERARRYHARAAEQADKDFGYASAVRHEERAIELAAPDDPGLIQLHQRLSGYAVRAFDWRRGLRAAQTAAELAAGVGDDVARGEALAFESFARSLLGDTQGSERAAAEAVRILEPRGDSVPLAWAYQNVSWHSVFGEPDPATARTWASRAFDVAARLGITWPQVFGLEVMGLASIALGDPDGPELLRRALDIATTRGTALDVHRAYNALYDGLDLLGDRSAQRQVREAQVAHVAKNGYRNMVFVARECRVAFDEGRWDDAIALADELSGSGSNQESVTQLRVAFIRVAREGPDAGLSLLNEPTNAAGDSPSWRTAAAYGALVLSLAGQPAAALAHAGRLLGPRWPQVRDHDAVVMASLLDATETATNPDPWLERGERQDIPERMPFLRARRAIAYATRAALGGATSDAARQLAESIVILDEEPSPYLATRARLRRAELLLTLGDREAADAEIARALLFWRQVGAKWYSGELRRWATSRGLAIPAEREAPSVRRQTLTLTDREREVASLVAQGLTNKQIGEKLVISERTAESHLERIRNKLGVSNRAQIAAWATETGLPSSD